MSNYTTEIARLTRLAEDHSRIAAGYREVIKGLTNVTRVDTEEPRLRANGGVRSHHAKAKTIATKVDRRWSARQRAKFHATQAAKRAAARQPAPAPIEHTPAALDELRLKLDEVAQSA